MFVFSSFAIFLSSDSFSRWVVRVVIEPANVESVEDGGVEVLVVLGAGAVSMGRMNLECVSVLNSLARQELGRMVMVWLIFL